MTSRKWSIDSFLVRIPVNQINITSADLGQKFVNIRKSDGEVVDERDKFNITHIENGVKTKYSLGHIPDGYNSMGYYVCVGPNAKLLKSQEYFDAIHKDNIRKVYDEIISQGHLDFDYKLFLNCHITDIDFKMDSVSDAFDTIISQMIKQVKPTKKKKEGYNKFNDPGNRGIEFGDRRTATSGKPFFKIYDKSTELSHKSNEFSQAHDLDYPSNLVRSEFTLKNKNHMKKYGIVDSRLKNMLRLDDDKLSYIFSDILKIYLDPRTINRPVLRENLTPADYVLYASIIINLEAGHTFEVVLDAITEKLSIKDKYRYKKKIRSIYDHHIKHQDVGKINEDVSGFFDKIGWN